MQEVFVQLGHKVRTCVTIWMFCVIESSIFKIWLDSLILLHIDIIWDGPSSV